MWKSNKTINNWKEARFILEEAPRGCYLIV